MGRGVLRHLIYICFKTTVRSKIKNLSLFIRLCVIPYSCMEHKRSYLAECPMIWGWVNDYRIQIVGWTIPFKNWIVHPKIKLWKLYDTNPTVIPDETGIYRRPEIRQERKKEKKRKEKRQQCGQRLYKKKYTVSLIKRKIQRSLGGPQDHF